MRDKFYIDAGDAAAYWSRWPSLPAVKQGRVIALPDGVVTLPGPYLDRGLFELATLLYGPELAAELADAAR